MSFGYFEPCMKCTAMLAAVLFLSLAGCSQEDPMGTVKGKVQLNGKPYAEDVSVIFMNMQTGQAASANIDSSGNFELEPLPLGTYNVFLAPMIEEGYVDPKPLKNDRSVPQKYWSEATTDISYDVTDGINEMTVDLKK